ncbi:hypothetical protein ACL2XP_25535 [Sodalis sp. RH21]|uniref:hypothetical protein n=1 Tax=unclassified Sodalis (in: enterobacteria) TaxID=2636512 RepID=UPI0039B52836
MNTVHPHNGPLAMQPQDADDEQTGALVHFQRQLEVVRNCCDYSRARWRQWACIQKSIEREAGRTDIHPYLPIMIGRQCIARIAEQLCTRLDLTRLTKAGIDTSWPHRLINTGRRHVLDIVDARISQPADQANDIECPAMHFVAGKFITDALDHIVNKRIRRAVVARNRSYCAAVNRLPPYRDPQGKAISIESLSERSFKSSSYRIYNRRHVLPYTLPGQSGEYRSRLYDKLLCRRLTANDLPPHEAKLIGQWGVMAASFIPYGTCIGIHTGVLVPPEFTDANIFDHDYLIALTVEEEDIYLDGDGIMSKINTLFDYDKDGHPFRQAARGYNVETAQFKATLSGGRTASVVALFTIVNIAPGQELRCNYHYLDNEVQHLNKQQADIDLANIPGSGIG